MQWKKENEERKKERRRNEQIFQKHPELKKVFEELRTERGVSQIKKWELA